MFDGAEGIRGQGKEVCDGKVPSVRSGEGLGMAPTSPFPEHPSSISISLVVRPSLRSCVLACSLFVCFFFLRGCNEKEIQIYKGKSMKDVHYILNIILFNNMRYVLRVYACGF